MAELHPYTPTRALLQCRWQTPEGMRDHPVVELEPGKYAATDKSSLTSDPRDSERPEWLGVLDAFPHRLMRESSSVTYSGYLACHVMNPFDSNKGKTVNTVIPVWEVGEDFMILQVDPTRLLVARALVDYISPTEQRDEYLNLRAGNHYDAPRTDTLM